MSNSTSPTENSENNNLSASTSTTASTTENSEIKHLSYFTRTIIDTRDLEKILKKGTNHGVCGGHNLGNTCFMNSSIACLSNCTELTTYFLSGKYKQNINTKNTKFGTGGKLAKAWYDLLEEYWNSKTTCGNPSKVKSTVAKKVPKFGGFGQQDSNEFMTEFLSILSEDLNKSNKKDYNELKEKGENEEEKDCAKRFWDNYQKFNDSIITDLFSGLLKNDVECSNCHYHNITFDPFNTLTLPIPPDYYLTNKKSPYIDIEFFYIPKYSIKTSCRIRINVKKDTPFKDLVEEINKIKNFKYNLKKLIYIKVMDSKFKGIIDQNLCKSDIKDHIFFFDDESKEGENNIIIPLYMFKNEKVSAFPRLLFLKENMNYGEFKKLLYYFARKYFKSPFANKTPNEDEKENKNEIYQVEKELEKYRKEDDDDNEDEDDNKKKIPYDENKLWDLFDKEYNEIFNNSENKKNKEELDKFFNDFPYKLILKRNYEDREEFVLFDGKNNYDNLKSLKITKDKDPITALLENEDCYIKLVLNSNSKFSFPDLNLNSCKCYTGKNYGRKQSDRYNVTLDDLLEYFSSNEEKGNEWKCSNCKKTVNFTKKISLFYLPRLLILCFNRFPIDGFNGNGKNDIYIDFQIENLDMGKYICENGLDKDFSKYDLFAVNQHYSGPRGGHYKAVCKNYDGNWYSYNDSKVSSTSPDKVVDSSAYVLFYVRHNF